MKKAKKTMKWGQDTGSGAEPQPGGEGGRGGGGVTLAQLINACIC